jgi:hypothetical protein
MNNEVLAIAFLIAGALLTTTAVTVLPAAYAGGDHDGGDRNKVKAEDESVASVADCDYIENSGTFSCFPSTAFTS